MRTLFTIIISLFILLACNKEEFPAPKSYPIVRTLEATAIDASGVTLQAEILQPGEEEIIDYGFVWYYTENGVLTEFKQSLGKDCNCERFELRVSSDLEVNKNYYYKPYLQTPTRTVFGTEKSFVSQGTAAPVITGFTPKSGTAGDTVLIQGENFSILAQRNSVKFGNEMAEVIAASLNQIMVVLADRISTSGAVKIVLTSGGITTTSTEDFVFEGHTINDFSPSSGILGETIVTINGNGFSSEVNGNQVLFDGYLATILEASANQLVVKLPYQMLSGRTERTAEARVSVVTNEKVTIAAETFLVKSRWRLLKPFPGKSVRESFFAFVNGKGYKIGGSDQYPGCLLGSCFAQVWEYNPANDTWIQKADFPGGVRSEMVGFVLNNKIYMGLGRNGLQLFNDWWEYDVASDSWTKKADFPGPGRYSCLNFATNEKGYLYGGYAFPGGVPAELFEYDPVQNSWVNKGNNFNPLYDFDDQANYFTHNGKIYFASYFYSHDGRTSESPYILEFNPENFEFKPLTKFPENFNISVTSRVFNVVIDDTLYLASSSGFYGEVACFSYNFTTKKWNRVEDFPAGNRKNGLYFSYLNNGFFGFGVREQGNEIKNDLWVYDTTIQ